MKPLLAAATAALLIATPAIADGKVYVQLPDLSSYTEHRAEEFLYQVVLANVVSSNCTGFEVTEAEWSLLTDSADLLAYGQLKLSTDDYDSIFYDQAFAALDEANTCEVEGPGVESVLEELVFQGGSRDPLPDQEAAYTEWRALMDRLQADADAAQTDAPASGKTKTK
ncbi:MAG: hypothetical protein P0Y65_19955 [Candidatus Devosia phytovorans]|uniref:Uncharacterized protein n=1 Tax=Candidatus Devosia phytovorans TaxID=3121372 RepID=A0AAJ6B0M3_9HYPH|nr:hypothetical protein [Devosia sp.]WEK04419.1 MAG: hypothetical protein P0Y65_19955 [Devosia sp.]